MRKASKLLYRFRGYILALFAVALIVCPASPLPRDLSHISEFVPYIAALFLYSCGIALRVRARQYIGQHTRGSTHTADELVTDGPYAYCRHPLYTSNLFIALGAVFFHLGTSQLLFLFAPALLLFEFALACAEDRFLEDKFGDTWRAWALRTPVFPYNPAVLFPKKAPAPKRTFFQAFRADASTWFWFVFFNLIIVLIKVFREYYHV
jgi:protein-S-isoprenylcysteine O-methyltransferase Ste14